MTTWSPFALVDCAAAPERIGTLQYHAAMAGLQHRSLFNDQPEAEHASAAPWLIELPRGAIQQPLDHWLASLGRTAAGVTRLAASVGFEPLLQHLQTLLDIALPDGKLALMRFYDPRAWLRYCQVLTAEQQRDLLGPALEWEVTLRGEVWTLALDALTQQTEATHAATDR